MNKLLAGLILTPWLPLVAQAQAQAPRLDTLQLSAAASMEVARDTLMLSFATTKEGSDAAQLQNQLKKALDEALVEARKIARPGQVEVQAGNLSLYPRYGQVKTASGSQNQLTGWQGTVEMQVQGRDMAAISQLSGRIKSLSINRVSYGLSPEARDKVEADVVARAIDLYKAKAALYAQQFGYRGYQIAEVSVGSEAPPMMMEAATVSRMKVMAAPMGEALPVESGKATVSTTVQGTVQMTR
mgnify:CR=1 FL=1